MTHVERLISIAQALVNRQDDFFAVKGAGPGDVATNAFMRELRERAKSSFGRDHSEQRICGANNLAVDFYFPEEACIVEIALSLRNPSSEFERDILKAIMARECGHRVERLLFLSKPGAVARTSQPGLHAFAVWAERAHHIAVEVRELAGQGGASDAVA